MVTNDLTEEYARKKRKARRIANVTRVRVILGLLASLPAAIGSSYLIYTKYDLEWSEIPIYLYCIWALSVLPVLGAYALFFKTWSRLRRPLDRATGIQPLDQAQFPELFRLLDEFSSRLAITERVGVVLNAHSRGSSPSVMKHPERGSTLILPAGFITLFDSNRPAAVGMLAHELSHVAHKDAQLWTMTTAFARALLYVIAPANAIGFVILIPTYLSDGEEAFITTMTIAKDALILSLPFFFFLSVKTLRRRSELLADLGGAVATSPSTIRTALEVARSNVVPRLSMHPPIADRMEQMNRLDHADAGT